MATVSVVMATIPGREDLMIRALNSVESQHRQPDQVVVEPDFNRTGAACTRNRALNKVTSDYVAILDDDDWLLPNHLKALMHVAEKEPDNDLIYPTPDVRNMPDPTAVVVGGRWKLPWGLDWTEDHRQHMIQRGNFVPVTCLIKTESLREVGGFPEPDHPDRRISHCEDWLCFRRMALKGMKFRHINVKTWVWEPNPLGHTGGLGT